MATESEQDLTVQTARSNAIEWVKDLSRSTVSLRAAYFTGSINWMRPEDLFPRTSDVDISLIFAEGAQLLKFPKFEHGGLLLEAGSHTLSRLSNPEDVLADYRRAGAFWKRGVFFDKDGELTAFQEQVASRFTDSEWVARRIKGAVENCLGYVGGFDLNSPFPQQVINWAFAHGVLCHVLLAGGMRNPTVRRRYSATLGLMRERGREDVHERLLHSLGCDSIGSATVTVHLNAMTKAFEKAKTVTGTGLPFASDVTEVARRVTIDGTMELIEIGQHREAVFWIIVTLARCQALLTLGGEPAKAAHVESDLWSLLNELGIQSNADLASSTSAVEDDLHYFEREATKLAETVI